METPGTHTDPHTKLDALRSLLRDLAGEGAVIGYSGGVDSAFLTLVAHQELGDRCVAVTALSESYAAREKDEALTLARRFGFRLQSVVTRELEDPRYAANPTNRCFFCKEELFTALRAVADELGFRWLLYGAIADDLGDHRPGALAAAQGGVRAPLQEVLLWKEEIRTLSRELGLPTWDKPSMACLSSRIPYGTRVEAPLLRRIEEAEEFLRSLGFRTIRVRHHDRIARIEIGAEEFPLVLENGRRSAIDEKFRTLGYDFVTVDLAGYRSGSMNTGRAEGGVSWTRNG
jgi:uncharacterized protein